MRFNVSTLVPANRSGGSRGLTLADMLRLESQAATGGSKKSVINIFLSGGPTHHDTFDLKPEAPSEIRGEFKPIATNCEGFEICELFPKLAQSPTSSRSSAR